MHFLLLCIVALCIFLSIVVTGVLCMYCCAVLAGCGCCDVLCIDVMCMYCCVVRIVVMRIFLYVCIVVLCNFSARCCD